MSSTMSCRWDRTKIAVICGFLFENVVFVKSVVPITQLSYIPCLFIYITLCPDVALDSARCSSLITLQVPVVWMTIVCYKTMVFVGKSVIGSNIHIEVN